MGAHRQRHGWSLQKLLEISVDFAISEPELLHRYLQLFNTMGGHVHRKNRKVVNTTLGMRHLDFLKSQSSKVVTQSEVLIAAVRCFLMEHRNRPFTTEELERKQIPEIHFPARSVSIAPFVREKPLDEIPEGAGVLVEASILFYAFVAIKPLPYGSFLLGNRVVSPDCYKFFQRLAEQQVVGYTTVTQINMLIQKLESLANSKSGRPFSSKTIQQFPAWLVMKGLRLVPEDPSAMLNSLADHDGKFRQHLFINSLRHIEHDYVCVATACDVCTTLADGHAYTPQDLTKFGTFTAPP